MLHSTKSALWREFQTNIGHFNVATMRLACMATGFAKKRVCDIGKTVGSLRTKITAALAAVSLYCAFWHDTIHKGMT